MMGDREKVLELTCKYEYIGGFFRGRIQMIKARIDAGCKTQAGRDCDSALEWLDKLDDE